MNYYLLCGLVFLAAYSLNLLYISVFYHRGLTHGAVVLRPWAEWLVIHTGNWVTGLDPKGWVCMHRMHHQYSDTEQDPHSPLKYGIFGVFKGQLHSYQRTLGGLMRNREPYITVVKDLNFPVSWLNRHRVWALPYILQGVIALAIGYFAHAWLLAYFYWVGMMSHPIQGWMVNSLAHRFGYRNFVTPDNSRNNTMVAWLVMGEGFQNNHHQYPKAAKFSVKWWEFDGGYILCQLARVFGMIRIPAAV